MPQPQQKLEDLQLSKEQYLLIANNTFNSTFLQNYSATLMTSYLIFKCRVDLNTMFIIHQMFCQK